MGDWQPDEHRVVDGRNIYLWIVPAVVGGAWTLTDGGATMQLTIDQRFQRATGTLVGGGRTLALRDASLRGNRFAFTVDTSRGAYGMNYGYWAVKAAGRGSRSRPSRPF
jgi:hypothetical protein